jgi:hypothetical protein
MRTFRTSWVVTAFFVIGLLVALIAMSRSL